MKKKSASSATIISIATVVVVFMVGGGLILVNNYLKNKQLPPAIPVATQTIEVTSRLTNPGGIDKVYLIDSAANLKQAIKLSSITGFDPTNQLLLGVVAAAKPNAGYSITLEQTTTQNNLVKVDYKISPPEPDQAYAEVISYPKMFLVINRTDLPAYSPLNFAFTNLTEGATQTIAWTGGTG